MQSSKEYKISVIIVTHNSQGLLRESLSSLRQSNISSGYEIIVVDNNSKDKSIDIVNDVYPNAKLIVNDKNIGFASACNIGVRNSLGEYILFYNPDLIIDPNSIERLLTTIESIENAGAVTGRMRFPDNSFQPTCRKFPTKENIIFSRGAVFSKFTNESFKYTLPEFFDITEVDAIAGTFMMIKKVIFEKIGMFDERFFMYMEDSDLCYRLNQAGFKNYFVPNAGGVHMWGKGSSTGRIKRSYHHHLSLWKYFLKHYPNSFSLLFLPVLLLFNMMLGIAIKRENK